MKTIKTCIALIMLIGLMACNNANSITENKQSKGFAPLKERSEILAQSSDWENIKNKASELLANIIADSNDLRSKLLLAQLYMQEARITGEHPYYYPAALTILDDVLRHDAQNFEALAFKASVLLSLHHFKEALEVGLRAKNINSSNGFIYGVLVDANVELGNYEEAVKMSDLMQSIRPGLESYSRASYLREIYGDNPGAIEAMKMAFQAGLPGSEEASWAGNTLAHLYENTGNLKAAREISMVVLQQRPSYAFAMDALGRIELASGKYDKAILYFDSAAMIMPEVSFYENKAKALVAKGDDAKAKEVYSNILTMLKEDAESGHYVDMELAMIYLESGDHEKALQYAKTEYDRRPENIDVNHTMAWVQYNTGNLGESKKHLDKAMRLGTCNAILLARAGTIEMALGNKKTAMNYMARAKKINPGLPGFMFSKS